MEEIRIDGVIGDWNNTVEEIQWRIEALGLKKGDDLKVIINSIGGSVFEGFAIYNFLVASEYVIHTEIQGICASIATLIAMAGEKKNTSISEVAMFMVHKASVGLVGNAEELEKQAEILNSIDDTLITVYSGRTGMKRNEVDKMLSEETWFNAKDTVKEGFIGSVINKISAKMVALASQNLKQNNMKIIDDLLKKYRGEEIKLTPEELVKNAKAEKVRFDALTPEEQKAETDEKARFDALTEEEQKAETDEKVRFDALTPEEQKAELEAIEKADAEAKEKADAKAKAENAEFVTKEDFKKLEDLVTNGLKSQADAVKEVVQEGIQDAIKHLPRSKAQPRVPQSQVRTPVDGYVNKYQKQDDAMKEIEKNTRQH